MEQITDTSTQTPLNHAMENTSSQTTQFARNSTKQYATLKPRIMEFNENGTIDEMLAKFLNKVKPIVGGIIIFKTPQWESFPDDHDELIKIGKDWSIAFSKKKSHTNVTTNIYFDYLKSTVTFKIKPFDSNRILIKDKNFDEIKNEIISNIGTYIENNNFSEFSKVLSYEIEGCENYPGNNIFKEESKQFAGELENKLKEGNYNFRVVIFMKNDRINVTLKRIIITVAPDSSIENDINIGNNK